MKASSADYSQYCKLILAHYLMVNIIDLVRMLMVECMEVQSGLWQRGLQLLVLEQSLRKTRTSSLENSAFLISLLLHIMYISLYFLSQLLHFNIFKILIFMTHTFHLTHSKEGWTLDLYFEWPTSLRGTSVTEIVGCLFYYE